MQRQAMGVVLHIVLLLNYCIAHLILMTPALVTPVFFLPLSGRIYLSLTVFPPLLHLCSVPRYLLKGDFPPA